ncbi:tensin-4-like isoform X2 [Salarias fasciatus]|uniref:tensin-4-like isoform X2 n=1 Tax=Salarias fasciatus TaxID=181472 RepID=UPI001176A15A|nr:tensin-4-like isoform X2 [Salarias fasciatus]
MRPTARGMAPVIPSHVLRVGQTIRIDSAQEAVSESLSLSKPSRPGDALEISLENLNQLILELDPTFELIQGSRSPSCISPASDASFLDDDRPGGVLVPRGCSPQYAPSPARGVSPSIPIPAQGSPSRSPQGALVFSGSPTCSLPPLPCGSAPRRTPSSRNDGSQGPLRPSHSNRNSAVSLLSTSTCSDTSYILGSTLSLTGDDSDCVDSIISVTPGSFPEESRMRYSPEKPPLTRRGPLQEPNGKALSVSPASVSGSQTDIPVLLINGAPQPDLPAGPEMDWMPPSPRTGCSGFRPHSSSSQPSMKFVMDTSKFWFRPHISRAEAEALIKDREAGAFVVRDSTSFRGSFGLVMKVEPESSCEPESGPDSIRHFLIESSPKGVRVKGSSQEPYFGSLSALVYQHTVSAYALPCRLLLQSRDLGSAEDKAGQTAAPEDGSKTACNFVYLNAVPTETLTGPCAVQRAVSSTLDKAAACLTPTIVNLKASLKGITLTDINRKLFFRRHYPAHLLSYAGEDPDKRL